MLIWDDSKSDGAGANSEECDADIFVVHWNGDVADDDDDDDDDGDADDDDDDDGKSIAESGYG